MITRRSLLLGAAGAAIAGPALAADESARAFVTAIYNTYKGKDAKGILLDNHRTIRRYFEPALAAAMIKDQDEAAKRGDVGNLDGDPFVDAQDFDIKGFDIAVNEPAPGKASATVKFTNFDKATTLGLDLVKIKGDWRIREIIWRRDGKDDSLRALFKK
jgi:hypothetical protein